MKRYLKMFIVFFPLLVCSASLFGDDQIEHKILHTFLKSNNLFERRDAFFKIVKDTDRYNDIVFKEFNSYPRDSIQVPDSLIYLATYIRDERYITFLAGLIEHKEYSYNSCIYSCPIVFSLAIYYHFSPYQLPELNRGMTPVADLNSSINSISKLVMINEKTYNYGQGPGVDPYLAKYEQSSTEELLQLAGTSNDDWTSRVAAAIILRCRILDDKFLPELYWLAITEPEKDVSREFRYFIYDAIYKTEKARLKRLEN